MSSREVIVILDFGSQYTQLIARRIREAQVFSEVVPYHTPFQEIESRRPTGIILSGGPRSVFEEGAPHPDPQIYSCGVPLLGICYGMQLLAHRFGGQVHPSRREYGKAQLERSRSSPLLEGLPRTMQVWMSHGDRIEAVPSGFRRVASTHSALAVMESRERRIFGVQFHPEVVHTPLGREVFSNFVDLCGCKRDWTATSFIESTVEQIRDRVGSGRAVCGLSGGVDSTVAAILVHKSIRRRLTCVFVDNGLLRAGEFRQVLATVRDELQLNVVGVEARSRFLDLLAGVEEPERKRKIIGETFIRVFEEECRKLGDVRFLVQGTLYPDVIESVSVKGPSAVIKSHHNVGGLPEEMDLELVEPLRDLFKDEVRQVGRELGLPREILWRQPFPGPGLSVRILGPVTDERLALLRQADRIVDEEIRRARLYEKIWQSFAVLLPVKSVGVMGDGRTYEHVVAIRAVDSVDGMTADWVSLPREVLARISVRIVNEVRGVNRVVYDVTSKPPGTIEWE